MTYLQYFACIQGLLHYRIRLCFCYFRSHRENHRHTLGENHRHTLGENHRHTLGENHRHTLAENQKVYQIRLEILIFTNERRIAKLVFRDLDLLFEGKNSNINMSEMAKANANMNGATFIEFIFVTK